MSAQWHSASAQPGARGGCSWAQFSVEAVAWLPRQPRRQRQRPPQQVSSAPVPGAPFGAAEAPARQRVWCRSLHRSTVYPEGDSWATGPAAFGDLGESMRNAGEEDGLQAEFIEVPEELGGTPWSHGRDH